MEWILIVCIRSLKGHPVHFSVRNRRVMWRWTSKFVFEDKYTLSFSLYMFLLAFRAVSLRLPLSAVLWFTVIISLSNVLRLHGEEIVEYWEGVKRSELRVTKRVSIDKHIERVGLKVFYWLAHFRRNRWFTSFLVRRFCNSFKLSIAPMLWVTNDIWRSNWLYINSLKVQSTIFSEHLNSFLMQEQFVSIRSLN